MPITSLPGGDPERPEEEIEDQVEIVEEDAPEEEGLELTDDGGAVVEIDGQQEVEDNIDFFDNLLGTELFPVLEAQKIVTELVDSIKADKQSREDFDKVYAEGIRRTGLGDDAPGGASFQGASKAVHPLLSKAAIDYASRAMGELFPGGGQIVRDEVLGQSDDFGSKKEREAYAARCDKAKRIAALMNWQLVHDVPEFRLEMDRLLTQTPLAGSQFMFWCWDERRNRPTCRYWPTDNVWFDYNATSASAAERLTLVEEITHTEFMRRVARGEYVMPEGQELSGSIQPEDQTEAQKATDKAQGVQPVFDLREGFHLMARCYTYLDIEGEERPYCLVIDLTNDVIVSCVRNWDPKDDKFEALQWAIEVPFLPWRGALSMGLIQFIGSLAGTATGAMRALLDSAHLNNFPAVLKLKGANTPGQNATVEATGMVDIEGGNATMDQDIRKLAMPLPYNPPSPALMQLLGLVTEMGEGFVQTALKNLAEGRHDMPVGTTLALIEQGLKTLSGIHARLHNAMTQMLKVVYRLNRLYITDEEIKDAAGVLLARRDDFQGPMDVVPVSDPEVFSDAQRYAQLQIVAERALKVPGLYNMRKVEELILQRTRIPNAAALLNPEEIPEEANAVTENVKMSMGKAAIALPHQNHLAHMQVLLDFLRHPMFGMNPLIAAKYLPNALKHLADHMVLWYAKQFEKVLDEAVLVDEHGPINLEEVWEEKDPEARSEMDALFATASPHVLGASDSLFAKVPEVIQQAQQVLQAFTPQPAPDPSVQTAQIRAQIDKEKEQAALQKTAMQEQAETARNTEDNQTKLTIAEMEAQLTRESMMRERADKDRVIPGNAMINGDLEGG